jgi:membrane-associated phospholipid phosphatase
MAIRQHVALDVLAGAALGAAVAFGHIRWVRRTSAPARHRVPEG